MSKSEVNELFWTGANTDEIVKELWKCQDVVAVGVFTRSGSDAPDRIEATTMFGDKVELRPGGFILWNDGVLQAEVTT